MSDRIKQLAESAFQPINDMASEGIADRHTFEQAWFQEYNQRFAEAIIIDFMNRLEREIELAYDQEEPYAAATLEALAIEMLDDFDIELPE